MFYPVDLISRKKIKNKKNILPTYPILWSNVTRTTYIFFLALLTSSVSQVSVKHIMELSPYSCWYLIHPDDSLNLFSRDLTFPIIIVGNGTLIGHFWHLYRTPPCLPLLFLGTLPISLGRSDGNRYCVGSPAIAPGWSPSSSSLVYMVTNGVCPGFSLSVTQIQICVTTKLTRSNIRNTS